MYARVRDGVSRLCCVLLLASSASAGGFPYYCGLDDPLPITLIQEGDSYDCIFVSGDLTMTGGHVNTLWWGGGTFDLQGGSIDDPFFLGGNASISGGDIGMIRIDMPTDITVHGSQFIPSANHRSTTTWFADATFQFIRQLNIGDLQPRPLILDDLGGYFSTDGDPDIDLDDLNNIRNNFGLSGFDVLQYNFIDHPNSAVDLDELNFIRNHFGESFDSQPVPEPSAFILLLLTMLGLGMLRSTGRG